ncbi:MAG: hypothetical protein GY754_03640, partial [bacterium]|nr:hypothetical protein [bacterium]
QSNHLKEIITTLAECGVEFIICGGVALVIHGIERMTLDIDISVDMEEGNLQRLINAMKKLHLSPRVPVPAESLMDPEKRRMMVEEKNALVFTFIDLANAFRQVDVFITDELSYDSLKGSIDTVNIDNHDVKLVSVNKLLELKRSVIPPREKDLFDISELEKLIDNNKVE